MSEDDDCEGIDLEEEFESDVDWDGPPRFNPDGKIYSYCGVYQIMQRSWRLNKSATRVTGDQYEKAYKITKTYMDENVVYLENNKIRFICSKGNWHKLKGS
jgi:hypothetical protein